MLLRLMAGLQSYDFEVNSEPFDFHSGVTAIDILDGNKDLTDQIIIDDTNVNYNVVGSYKVIYSVTSSANKTTTKENQKFRKKIC